MVATSTTWRPSGPIASCVLDTGMMPLKLSRPRVGRRPTIELADAGERTEFTVSEPVPAIAKLAARAAPVPPLEPPGVRVRS
jgi:hypothetical protein